MVWTPGYDVRELKRERGLECVRDAADRWARHGRSAIDDEVFLAVFVRLLLAPERYRTLKGARCGQGASVPDLPVRPLDEWAGLVGTATEECARPTPGYPQSTGPFPVRLLMAQVSGAADQWALGDPEQPPTILVFRELARILEDNGLLPWWGESSGAKP